MLVPVAKRYAQALYQIARDSGRIEQFDTQAELVDVVFSDKGLREFMLSPEVAVERKKELIDMQLGDRLDIEVLNLLKLLVDKRRIGHASGIMRYFDRLTDMHRGVEEVTIVTAVSLDEQQKNAILEVVKQFSSYENLSVKQVVDPSILGGVIVRLGEHKVLDGSLLSRLAEMKNRMYHYRHTGMGA